MLNISIKLIRLNTHVYTWLGIRLSEIDLRKNFSDLDSFATSLLQHLKLPLAFVSLDKLWERNTKHLACMWWLK